MYASGEDRRRVRNRVRRLRHGALRIQRDAAAVDQRELMGRLDLQGNGGIFNQRNRLH
jgi:hypothetical protein